MNFSSRLKTLRIESGYTQKELGKLLGVGRTTISEYENGNIVPKQDGLIKIADIFDVSVDYLTGVTDSPLAEHLTLVDGIDIEIIDWVNGMKNMLKGDKFMVSLFGDKLDFQDRMLIETEFDQLYRHLEIISNLVKLKRLKDEV